VKNVKGAQTYEEEVEPEEVFTKQKEKPQLKLLICRKDRRDGEKREIGRWVKESEGEENRHILLTLPNDFPFQRETPKHDQGGGEVRDPKKKA